MEIDLAVTVGSVCIRLAAEWMGGQWRMIPILYMNGFDHRHSAWLHREFAALIDLCRD